MSSPALEEKSVSRQTGGMVRKRTKWHLNLVCNSLDAHESECDDGDDGDHSPAELADKSQGQREEIERDTLFEVDSICMRSFQLSFGADSSQHWHSHEMGIGVFATRSIAVRLSTIPWTL